RQHGRQHAVAAAGPQLGLALAEMPPPRRLPLPRAEEVARLRGEVRPRLAQGVEAGVALELRGGHGGGDGGHGWVEDIRGSPMNSAPGTSTRAYGTRSRRASASTEASRWMAIHAGTTAMAIQRNSAGHERT